GDITFTSDVGRAFSILVLMSGIVLLLIVLPFAFIRYFYAPWLEAQLRNRVPSAVDPDMRGHVVFAAWDSIAQDTAPRLRDEGIPFFVVAEEGGHASQLHAD